MRVLYNGQGYSISALFQSPPRLRPAPHFQKNLFSQSGARGIVVAVGRAHMPHFVPLKTNKAEMKNEGLQSKQRGYAIQAGINKAVRNLTYQTRFTLSPIKTPQLVRLDNAGNG